jgi:hypothetical protein
MTTGALLVEVAATALVAVAATALMLVTHTTAPVIIALLMVEVVVATRMVLEPTATKMQIAALPARKCLSLLLNDRKTHRKGHHCIVLCQESPVGALTIQA